MRDVVEVVWHRQVGVGGVGGGGAVDEGEPVHAADEPRRAARVAQAVVADGALPGVGGGGGGGGGGDGDQGGGGGPPHAGVDAAAPGGRGGGRRGRRGDAVVAAAASLVVVAAGRLAVDLAADLLVPAPAAAAAAAAGGVVGRAQHQVDQAEGGNELGGPGDAEVVHQQAGHARTNESTWTTAIKD